MFSHSQCLLIKAKGNISIQERQSNDLRSADRALESVIPIRKRENDGDSRIEIGLKANSIPTVQVKKEI